MKRILSALLLLLAACAPGRVRPDNASLYAGPPSQDDKDKKGPGAEKQDPKKQDPKDPAEGEGREKPDDKEGKEKGKEKGEPLEAVVESVKGIVDVKRPTDKDWVPAAVKMKLPSKTEICTAVASRAIIALTEKIKVEVRPLSQVQVDDLFKTAGAINTGVNLKFGTIKVDIQKGDVRADMKVSSPNSTTSVSGSTGLVRSRAAGRSRRVALRVERGTWLHEYLNHLLVTLTGSGVATNGGDLTVYLQEQFRRDMFVDFYGRTDIELYRDTLGGGGDPFPPGTRPIFEVRTLAPWGKSLLKSSALPLPPALPGSDTSGPGGARQQ